MPPSLSPTQPLLYIGVYTGRVRWRTQASLPLHQRRYTFTADPSARLVTLAEAGTHMLTFINEPCMGEQACGPAQNFFLCLESTFFKAT